MSTDTPNCMHLSKTIAAANYTCTQSKTVFTSYIFIEVFYLLPSTLHNKKGLFALSANDIALFV